MPRRDLRLDRPLLGDAIAVAAIALQRVGLEAARLRRGWRRILGAPDYEAYLAHHAQRHAGTEPMSERQYVELFIERRFNRRGAGRCC